MKNLILFDDIEILLPEMLRASLGKPVGRSLPTDAVSEYITVRRQGGIRRKPITESVRVGINVYAKDDKTANDLALLVRAHIETYENQGPFKNVSVDGIVEIPDNSNYRQRYFVATLDMRGYPAEGA